MLEVEIHRIGCALDQVALPLKDPFLLRAPFLDVRPIAFDKTPKDGETLKWRDYILEHKEKIEV